ncbi:MAG: ABC transporter substrate-binding protein [Halovenus sp.]
MSDDDTYTGSDRVTGIPRRAFLKTSGVGALALTAGCLGDGDDSGDDGSGDGSGDDGSGDGSGDDDSMDDSSDDGGTTEPDIDGPITIGALLPLPGQFPGGTAQQQATELRVKQANENGGLLGEEVNLVVKDSGLDPSTALDRYREFQLEEEVDATFGLFGSEPGLRVAEAVSDFENILVLGGVSTTDVEGLINDDYESYKYVFRAMNNGTDFGNNLARVAQEKWADWGFDRIGVAVEDITGWRSEIQPIAVEGIPDDIEVAFTEVFSSDTTDFSPILDRGESEDIDFLYTFTAHGGSAINVQWARRQPDFAAGGADVFSSMPTHWENTDGLIEHVWTYVPGSGPGFEWNDQTHFFIDSHTEEYGGPPPHSQAYTQYDAVDSWMRAVEAAGTLDEDTVVEFMEQELEFEATTGYIDYAERDDEFPHRPKFGEDGVMSPVIQWQEVEGEGQQVGLWPDRVDKGDYIVPPWIE